MKRVFHNKVLYNREEEIITAVMRDKVFDNSPEIEVKELLYKIEKHTIDKIGWYYPHKDYVGPNGILTHLIPPAHMNIPAYLHDGAYHAIENSIFSWLNQELADKLFKSLGEVFENDKDTKPSITTKLYYSAVKWFGKFFLKAGKK